MKETKYKLTIELLFSGHNAGGLHVQLFMLIIYKFNQELQLAPRLEFGHGWFKATLMLVNVTLNVAELPLAVL